jgi:GT2 family glycosyltransferase
MDISIIIPNFNGEGLLRKNLPKIFDSLSIYKSGKTEVIVIDDKSEDASLNLLESFKQEYKNLKIYKNEKNLGFSSSVNKGANNSIGEILILLNTDAYPQKDFLEPLIKDFEDENVFAVGCLDKSVEGDKTVLRGRGLGEWKKGFLIHRRGEVNQINTLWASGGSGAFRKSIWSKLGGLNELYNPFYWEDIDLSYRALKSGYKILFESKSVVVHEHDKGAIKNKYSIFQIKTIAYRNQFIFVWENATDFSLQIKHLLYLPYHFAKALLRLDLAFFLGFLKALIILPKVIESSIKYDKQFIKKDSEVIKFYQ